MRPEARKPRRRRIALTSLIDVIFILLLFFLLTSTFSRFGELSLATISNGAGVETSDTAPVFVQLRADDLTINGTAHTLDTVAPALREIAPTDAGHVAILVAVTPEVSSQRLVDLLMQLRALSWASVSVLG